MKKQILLPVLALVGASTVFFASSRTAEALEPSPAVQVASSERQAGGDEEGTDLAQSLSGRRQVEEAGASNGDGLSDPGGVLRPAPGRRYHHSLSAGYRSSIELSDEHQGVMMSLSGELVVSVLGRVDDEWVLGVKVDQAALSVEINGDKITREQEDALVEASGLLSRETLFHMDQEGRVLGVNLPDEVDPGIAHWMRSLVCNLQLLRPAGESGSWQVEEQGTLGLALVDYDELEPGPDGLRRFVKACRALQEGPGGEAAELRTTVSGGGELSVEGSDGWYRSLSYDEETTVSLGEGFRTTVRGLVQIERTSESTCAVYTEEELREVLSGSWSSLSSTIEAGAGSLSRGGRGGVDADQELDSILAEIEALVAAGEIGSYELYAARRRLARLVAANPGILDRMRLALLSGSYDLSTVSVALGSVGESGAAGAMEWLSELASDSSVRDDMRLASVLSLSQIEAPSPEVLSMLAGIASSDGVGGELGSSALLVLGAMTRFDSSGVGMESLLGLKELAEERGVRPWLLALGNAGTVAAGEAALEYIADPNPGVRVAALLAAASLGPEAAAEHGSLALQDEESSVRAAGAQLAYENASAEELAELSGHLDNEGSVIVRGEAYRALAARSDDAGHSLLIERLALESDGDLRTLLEELLQAA